MGAEKPFAFVLMPFDPKFDDVYRLAIQAAAQDSDVIAERVDEQFYSETMLERIYRQIDAADFIIADMTGQNPNVFYEVGYAHAKGKLCTLLTQEARDIPFDLKQHRHLVYGNSINKLKSMLISEINWIKSDIANSKSNTLDIELKSYYGDLEKNENFAYVNISFTIDIHNKTNRTSP